MKKFIKNLTVLGMLALTASTYSMERSLEEQSRAMEQRHIIQKKQNQQIDAAITELNESTRVAARAANHLKKILSKAIAENTKPENMAETLRAMHGAALLADTEMQTSQKRIIAILKYLHQSLKSCYAKENRREEERIYKEIEAATKSEADDYVPKSINGEL